MANEHKNVSRAWRKSTQKKGDLWSFDVTNEKGVILHVELSTILYALNWLNLSRSTVF